MFSLTIKGVILAVIVGAMLPCVAAEPGSTACPAHKLLPTLDTSYHECSHGFDNGSCATFIETFKKLLPTYSCKRSFDTSPVPAVWLADDAALEDYVKLLSGMKEPAARKLFGSEVFRAILDGALAEDYGDLSRQVEADMKTGNAP